MWDIWFDSQIKCSKIEHLSNIDEMNLKTKNSQFLMAPCVNFDIWLWFFNGFYCRWTSTCYEVGPIWRTSGCQFSWLKPGGFIWYQNHSCRYFVGLISYYELIGFLPYTAYRVSGLTGYPIWFWNNKQSKDLSKGQKISKAIYGSLNSSKKRTKKRKKST